MSLTLYEVYSIDPVTDSTPVWFRSADQKEVRDWIMQKEEEKSPHNFYWRKEVGK